jgi:hypothetical protein
MDQLSFCYYNIFFIFYLWPKEKNEEDDSSQATLQSDNTVALNLVPNIRSKKGERKVLPQEMSEILLPQQDPGSRASAQGSGRRGTKRTSPVPHGEQRHPGLKAEAKFRSLCLPSSPSSAPLRPGAPHVPSPPHLIAGAAPGSCAIISTPSRTSPSLYRHFSRSIWCPVAFSLAHALAPDCGRGCGAVEVGFGVRCTWRRSLDCQVCANSSRSGCGFLVLLEGKGREGREWFWLLAGAPVRGEFCVFGLVCGVFGWREEVPGLIRDLHSRCGCFYWSWQLFAVRCVLVIDSLWRGCLSLCAYRFVLFAFGLCYWNRPLLLSCEVIYTVVFVL